MVTRVKMSEASTEAVAPAVTLKTMPLDAAAEVVEFLADREEFAVTTAALQGEVSEVEIRAVLRELAMILRKTALFSAGPVELTGLSTKTKKIMSCLSPREEKNLLTHFGLIDKP